MFEFNRTLIPNRQADLDESHSVYPQIQNFETWMETNKGEFK